MYNVLTCIRLYVYVVCYSYNIYIIIMYMYTYTHVVMWSFKIVLCNKDCDLKSCKNVDDYITNLDDCRGTAAVYRYFSIGLGMIPLTGICNFYSGNNFDGVFELVEGLVALFSIWCGCIYCCDEIQHRNDNTHPLLVCELASL